MSKQNGKRIIIIDDFKYTVYLKSSIIIIRFPFCFDIENGIYMIPYTVSYFEYY